MKKFTTNIREKEVRRRSRRREDNSRFLSVMHIALCDTLMISISFFSFFLAYTGTLKSEINCNRISSSPMVAEENLISHRRYHISSSLSPSSCASAAAGFSRNAFSKGKHISTSSVEERQFASMTIEFPSFFPPHGIPVW